ncbi:MAG: TetR family transcriptional regulator [Microthrixaceae bacterium]
MVSPGIDSAAAAWVGETTRARRRRATRRHIAETAMDLFETQGYPTTTVDEIAVACDIGRRTFFRYFQAKEELLYPFLEESLAIVASVLRRSADVPPFAAVRAGFAQVALGFQRDAEFHLRCGTVAMLQHGAGRPVTEVPRPVLNDLAFQQTERDIAELMRVDPVEDPRPTLITGSAVTVFGSAYVEWLGREAGVSLPDLVEQRFATLFELLTAGV